MALTDFDLEVLLNEAMEDNAVPSEELNKKLKRKVRTKSALKGFNINLKSVAAVVLVVAAVGVFSKNGSEIKNTTSQLAGQNVTTADRTEQLEKKLTENTAIIPVKKEEKQKNTKAAPKKQIKKTPEKSEEKNVVTDNSTIDNQDIMIAAEEQVQVAAFSGEEEAAAAVEDVKEEKSYKYLEIAADGIGKALDELNETVNSYIDGIYNSAEEYPMIASARSVGTGESEEIAEKTVPECSYEVICDDEKYFSVCVEVKSPEDGEVHTKYYTVDKENEMLVLENEALEEEATEDIVTEN